jgi:hypothetical protein
VTRRVLCAPSVLGLALAGCAYYNGMWSAERLARDARRQEARGLTAEARLSWGRAATKAESVLVHHPSSRWADDALVLQGEGLAWSGACPAAAQPLARALREVNDAALRERAAIAAATCALSQGAGDRAERLLGAVLGSRDGRRSSAASYLAGRAAVLRGDPAEAAERFAHSDLPEAAPSRVGALAAAGRPRDAVALLDSVARRDDDESRWTDALSDIARTGGMETAADALDRLLARGKLRAGPRARLLIADGDRQRQARRFTQATARYAAAASLVPDSAEAGVARVHALLAEVAQLTAPGQLDSVADRLEGLTRSTSGAAPAELRDLTRWIADARSEDTSGIAAFRSAERVRDSLAAPALAAALFRRFAVRHPGSIFAPKALIAAGQLQPETLDSVESVLRTRYADSPYALAFHGAASPAFQATEDSLAVALGVGRAVVFTARPLDEIQVAPPRTGPRGPELDPPVIERAAGRVVPGPRRPVPVRRQDDRPKPRPADRPDERP